MRGSAVEDPDSLTETVLTESTRAKRTKVQPPMNAQCFPGAGSTRDADDPGDHGWWRAPCQTETPRPPRAGGLSCSGSVTWGVHRRPGRPPLSSSGDHWIVIT